ncbi:MAG: hypothetical protein ACT443_11655 [Gemmatimonadota bacterium]
MFVVLLLLAVFPTMTAAQSPAESILREAAGKNWTVRASADGRSLGEGRVVMLKADTVVLSTARIPIASITALDRRTRVGGAGREGALVGAIGFGMFGLFLAREFCKPDCSLRDTAGGVGFGATFGASLGGLIGGIANPAKRGWTRVWP